MMEKLDLPPRLARIASLVPPGSRIADVGTDHGLLPAWLLQNGVAVSAVATDIRPGPLSRAETLCRELGLASMRCVLCDGLEGVDPHKADTVIVAGMGGENIAEILRRAPWTAFETLLLLQPMSRPEALREALNESGIAVHGEYLVRDAGRIYPIIAAGGGEPAPYSAGELYLGRFELVSGEELFPEALSALMKKLDRAVAGLERSAREEDRARLDHLRMVREELDAMRRRKDAESI